jgi:hypothetical protein
VSKLVENLKYHLANAQGWRTNRKIVVIESDDWGSIRSTNNDAVNKLRQSGLDVEKCHYLRNDALESEEDLEHLFNTLKKFKDFKGNHPVITANVLVANPDFEKIEYSGFSNYYNESVTKTFKRSRNCDNSFALWKQGLQDQIFFPQSHGREHLNIPRWMHDLQSNNLDTRLAFDLRIFGLSANVSKVKRGSYLAAYDLGIRKSIYDRKSIVKEGLVEFEKLMGYRSKSFIAPNYVWDNEIEEAIFEGGVQFIQTSFKQNLSKYADDNHRSVRHYTGKVNKNNQIYITRNVYFEPSENPEVDWVGLALKQMDIAFTWGKPAVISSHRVNFIGSINESNRMSSLSSLEILLSTMIKRWPKVEFITSAQLGSIIAE